jgi:hypothetical protein
MFEVAVPGSGFEVKYPTPRSTPSNHELRTFEPNLNTNGEARTLKCERYGFFNMFS